MKIFLQLWLVELALLTKNNFFFLLIFIFLSCQDKGNSLTSQNSDIAYKEYTLNSDGSIEYTEMSIHDFQPSKDCKECHETHYNEWVNSMHAYSMRGPLFFSRWNEEKIKRHTGERFCVQCHSPVAFVTGTPLDEYSSVSQLQESYISETIKEGVGCDICHTVTQLSPSVHTDNTIAAIAKYFLNPGENIKYGSLKDPVSNTFHDSEYNPIYARSEICLPCHDLTVRDVEAEITFTEWNRIPGLSMSGALSCQECHMPMKSNGYHDHSFVGVGLDLTYSPIDNPQYQSVENLLNSALDIKFGSPTDTLVNQIKGGDTLKIPITISSKTAHSIPSGVSFAREAWLRITIKDNNENIIFESGDVLPDQPLSKNDPELLYFTSYLLDENLDTTSSVTDVKSIINNSLMAFSERFHLYKVKIPPSITGNIKVDIKMLFRNFKPTLLDQHEELLQNLTIFVMADTMQVIEVIE